MCQESHLKIIKLKSLYTLFSHINKIYDCIDEISELFAHDDESSSSNTGSESNSDDSD